MEVRVRTFQCDKPACQSYCTLHPSDSKTPAAALRLRGWQVVDKNDDDPEPESLMCYCPIHATKESFLGIEVTKQTG